jgi:hypothetical protein
MWLKRHEFGRRGLTLIERNALLLGKASAATGAAEIVRRALDVEGQTSLCVNLHSADWISGSAHQNQSLVMV